VIGASERVSIGRVGKPAPSPGGVLGEALVGVRFCLNVPRFLRAPTPFETAVRVVRRRREARADAFLAVLRHGVYANPSSPYRALLARAGCAYGDLERLVSEDGVEGALRALLRQGVYLTSDEFKGRRPVTRGGTTVLAGPANLRNPGAAFHVPAGTGGSRGQGTPVLVDLEFVRECGMNSQVVLAAHGGARWRKAHWLVPGGSALTRVLEHGSFGECPVRWFSQVDPSRPGVHPRYRWSSRLMHWASLLTPRPLPRLEYVSVEDPQPIAQWMADELAAGATPHLYTYPSCAVRVCVAARVRGVALDGARFTVVGEPVTAARVAAIRAVGAEALPRYATTDAGPLGDACGAPEAPDDVHFYDDLHALIQPEGEERPPGLVPGSLLHSTLRSRAPFVLLNVSLGDRAVIRHRACGCALDAHGWSTHLHTIRSDEKLTAGGMNFADSDVVRVLEEVLPDRFGGTPTDYQLVEDVTRDGQPCVRLLVHPRLGPLDPVRVGDAFLTALGEGSRAEQIMALQWRALGLLGVERQEPRVTRAGKILHIHATTPSSGAGAR
jgi:hypothetical protein